MSTYDIRLILDVLLADIELSLEAMEEHNDRSPHTEIQGILRAHAVPSRTWHWRPGPRAKALGERWRVCMRAWRTKWDKLIADGLNYSELAEAMNFESNSGVTRHRRRVGLPVRGWTSWAKHVPMVQAMLDKGHTMKEIADAMGVPDARLRQGLHRIDFSWPDARSNEAKRLRDIKRIKHGLPPLHPTKPGPKPRKKP